jgi:hypothetical protein
MSFTVRTEAIYNTLKLLTAGAEPLQGLGGSYFGVDGLVFVFFLFVD